MEMESAGPSAKRGKLAALDIHGEARPPPPPLPAVVAAEATDLEPKVAEWSEEPPAGVEKDEDELLDRISLVPDQILGEIISLLPLNEGARTQILARRWRHVWRAAPLNLDFRGLPASGNMLPSRCVLVSDILAAHHGSGRRLCLPGSHLQFRADAVDAWLRSEALDNLQELEFYFYGKRHRAPDAVVKTLLPPPASIFRFSSTLRVATISNCYLLADTVETLRFEQLKKLALIYVKISEVSLHKIINAGCPRLECLLLSTITRIRCLRINSPTLRSIGIRSSSEELVIEDAPSLERLLYLERIMRVQILVISAPKLETLGCISKKYKDIKIVGSTFIQGLRTDSRATVVRTVKILAIHMLFFDQDVVISLMRRFPCLEKFYAKEISGQWEENAGHPHDWNLLTSLDIRLRTIELRCYSSSRLQVQFATFFVLNARMLESIRLEVEPCNYNEDFFAEQHRMLQMEKRASRGAQLCFTTSCHHDVSGIMHVDDLDSAEPFACGC